MINKLINCIVGFWKNSTVRCSIQQWLDTDYEKPQQKINWSLFLVILVPILIFMGFLYLVGFLSRFSISYDLVYFNARDCIDILYKKGVLYFYTVNWYIFLLLLITICLSILFFSLRKKNKKEKGKKKNSKVICELLLFTGVFSIYLQSINNQEEALSFVFLVFLNAYFFLFLFCWKFLKIKLILLVSIVSISTITLYKIGEKDAEKVEKARITFDIILQDNDTILKRGDKNRYFIYKTTEYVFIMDEIRKDSGQVIISPTSEIRKISFNHIKKKSNFTSVPKK